MGKVRLEDFGKKIEEHEVMGIFNSPQFMGMIDAYSEQKRVFSIDDFVRGDQVNWDLLAYLNQNHGIMCKTDGKYTSPNNFIEKILRKVINAEGKECFSPVPKEGYFALLKDGIKAIDLPVQVGEISQRYGNFNVQTNTYYPLRESDMRVYSTEFLRLNPAIITRIESISKP